MKNFLINKELSWLSFNERVLQEADDKTVPLFERIRFLGIFSANMDEFFRVRVAVLKKLLKFEGKAKKIVLYNPKAVLKKIQGKVLSLQERFDDIYQDILKELAMENIHIINEKELSVAQASFVKSYFHSKVRSKLIPVIIDQAKKIPDLKDHYIYLAVVLKKESGSIFAIIEIPTHLLPRFVVLPQIMNKKYIMLLDDVIRFGISEIFVAFHVKEFDAYTIKVTRDSELEIESDISESYVNKILKSVKQRKEGSPVRFIYDANLPKKFLRLFMQHLQLESAESLISGSKYHNFRDFMNFPDFGIQRLRYEKPPRLPHKDFKTNESIFSSMEKKDIMIYTCYQSFDYLIDLLREAAIDKNVDSIKMTIYRAAKYSSVMNALINAAKNGKQVTVVLEIQARFDEEANINWADKLQEEGVKVVIGVPYLKIHAKLCLITTKKGVNYAVVGTGNFNEDTAKDYSDAFLFTTDKRLTYEIEKMFDFFQRSYKFPIFKHLIVSPFQTKKKIIKLIKNEIKNVKYDKPAYIKLKLNNLVDYDIIRNLNMASKAGVKVTLIVRGMFSMKTGIKGVNENIEAFGIVDKYLEHSRIFVFANGGDPKYFISSADMMSRNLNSRVEVTCPVYSKEIQNELNQFFEIQCSDNVKARVLNSSLDNRTRETSIKEKIRSQEKFYEILKSLHSPG